MRAHNAFLAAAEPPQFPMPAPAQLLWEFPFWLVMLYIALVPGSMSPWWSLGGVPVRSAEGVLLAVAACFGIAAIVRARLMQQSTARCVAVTVFLAMCCWGLVSTCWSETDDENQAAMRLSLMCSAAAASVAWNLLREYSRAEIHQFLWRLTAWLALVSLLYSAESILSLGLRTEMGQTTLLDFGIERVKGPLYGSSTGYFILLPALAFAVHEAVGGCRKIAAVGMVLVLLTALLGLGSRAALVLLAVYLLMLSLMVRSGKKRIVAIGLTVSLSALASAFVFNQASTSRLQSFNDDVRKLTYATAWRTLAEQDWQSVLRGSGYGGIWNWYLSDVHNGDRLAAGDNVIRTPMGLSLYHSHSTLLTSALELGLPGLLGFAVVGGVLISVAIRSWRQGRWQALAYGLFASGLSFFFDLFLFKNNTVNVVWWLYAVSTIRLTQTDKAWTSSACAVPRVNMGIRRLKSENSCG